MHPAQNRFAVEDVVPPDASEDVEFQRAVQQLEDLQNPRGYVYAKGAFDRGDQAYLKEQEERRRHVEEAVAERERAEFVTARARAQVDTTSAFREGVDRIANSLSEPMQKRQTEVGR
jgi:hypothetical protein